MSLVIVLSAPLKKLRIHEWTRLLYFRGKYFLYKFFQSSKVLNLYYNYNQHQHYVWWIYLFTYHPDFGDCHFALYTSQKSCSASCQCWWLLLKSCHLSLSLSSHHLHSSLHCGSLCCVCLHKIYFKEVHGWKNLIYFSVATFLVEFL